MATTEREDDRDHFTLEDVAASAVVNEGIAIESLEPGATLVVRTRNSRYRFVILSEPSFVLVKGGALFPQATIVRLVGATASGSVLKMGWILVGFRMEMWLGSVRITSSHVRSVAIDERPAL